MSRDIFRRANQYIYAKNSPTSWVDITGNEPESTSIYPPPSIHPRERWNADPPNSTLLNPDRIPKRRITIHHQGNSGKYLSDDPLLQRQEILEIQRKQMNKDFGDIGYNFIIDKHGNIYDGRGLSYVPAHIQGDNPGNIGILMLGYYGDRPITADSYISLCRLLDHLSSIYGIALDTNHVGGHRAMMSRWGDRTADTECPGAYLSDKMAELVKRCNELSKHWRIVRSIED